MQKLNLCLHCGGHTATLDEVTQVPTPEPTETWRPISHRSVYDQVVSALANLHMTVAGEQHALAKDGLRYFSLLQVEQEADNNREWGYVVGLRNSHDRSTVCGLSFGSGVFVCDNLAFTGEITIARKHTTHIERDLPILTTRACGRLASKWVDMDHRFERYKELEVNESRVHDITIRAMDCGAIIPSMIPHVLKEWRHPSIVDWAAQPKTLWRWFNSVTQVSKGTSIFMLPKRTESLHALCDATVGLEFKREEITAGTEDAEVVVNN